MLAADAGLGSAGLPCETTRRQSWRLPPRLTRGCGTPAAICSRRIWDACVERILLMNPADVAQSALPLASTDVSLIALFLQAHWIVKAVMLGLLACSVWVVDRGTLSRALRQADAVDGGLLRRGDARMETVVRKPGALLRRASDADRESHERLDRQGNQAAGTPPAGAGDGRLGRPVCRPVRHGVGHHVELPVDRGLEKHLAGRGRPGHRGGPVCNGYRPYRRHSGHYLLQQVHLRGEPAGAAAGRLRR